MLSGEVRSREKFWMPAGREQWTRYRGRRPKASEERTRKTAASNGRLWGFGRAAALAEDGFEEIGESRKALRIAARTPAGVARTDRGLISDVVLTLTGAGMK
jgi:hypothetical protein